MPTNLTGSQIKDTFTQLLHVDGGPAAGEKLVYSGAGVATAFRLGTVSASVGNIQFSTNTISTTNTNGDLVLAPNGTGSVNIAKAAITGGSITGITDLAIADGGTGASSASTARTNLGLGSLATQNANSVTITGGSISGVSFSGAFTGVESVTATSFFTDASAAGVTLTGNGLLADGTDANIDIVLTPKGTGALVSGGKMGYSAGGAVTQLTSKSTGVTLNALSGQVTMHNAQLSRNTGVVFTLTNSFIAATDVVIVNIASGATSNAYTATVDAVAAGSCSIHLHNHLTGSDLSEAVVLNFIVLKGAHA